MPVAHICCWPQQNFDAKTAVLSLEPRLRSFIALEDCCTVHMVAAASWSGITMELSDDTCECKRGQRNEGKVDERLKVCGWKTLWTHPCGVTCWALGNFGLNHRNWDRLFFSSRKQRS